MTCNRAHTKAYIHSTLLSISWAGVVLNIMFHTLQHGGNPQKPVDQTPDHSHNLPLMPRPLTCWKGTTTLLGPCFKEVLSQIRECCCLSHLLPLFLWTSLTPPLSFPRSLSPSPTRHIHTVSLSSTAFSSSLLLLLLGLRPLNQWPNSGEVTSHKGGMALNLPLALTPDKPLEDRGTTLLPFLCVLFRVFQDSS